ncbi:MAG: DUF2087 domain-containing protein [Pseudomonadota bacterium]
MPRELTPLVAADLSTFAKTLRNAWVERLERGAGAPSHVELLNLLARAAGHRNVQALRAARTPVGARATPPARGPRQASLTDAADRALRQFDAEGRLTRWPTKRSLQLLVLWGLWLRFDTRRRYTEREVNQVLNAHHGFGDHCLLRRELVEMRLLARTPGGAEYRKLAARPDAEVVALLSALRQRAP